MYASPQFWTGDRRRKEMMMSPLPERYEYLFGFRV